MVAEISLAEDMALNEENQRWVRDQIREAINPRGSRKVAYWLRSWGILGIVITAFLALIAIAVALGVSAFNRVEENAKFRQHTDDRFTANDGKLSGIETRLTNIESSLLTLRIERASATPDDPKSQSQAKEVLAAARKESLRLSTDSVEQAGNAFIKAASGDRNAWDVALNFVNYRSSLNTYARIIKAQSGPVNVHFEIGPEVPGKTVPKMLHIPITVSSNDAARLEEIGHNLNENLAVGTAQLILEGGAIILDRKYIKHVQFKDVEIHYNGQPLILEDAMFVNCTFVMDNTSPARKLGVSLLAAKQSVNFNSRT